MRRLVIALFLTLWIAAPSAHAQTGSGALRGVVMPVSAHHIGGFGDWTPRFDAATRAAPQAVGDSTPVATLTLTPIATLRDRTHTAAARGMYGRYDAGRLSMGRYLLRVEAEGCVTYEAEVVILSDSQSVQHVALRCAWADD